MTVILCRLTDLGACRHNSPQVVLWLPLITPLSDSRSGKFDFCYSTPKTPRARRLKQAYPPAEDAAPLGSDTSLRTSTAALLLACSAMSASATMPQQEPAASTTGTRRI